MRGRGSIVLAVIAVIAILLLAFFFVIRPRQGALTDVREQVEAEEAETTQLEAELARLEALREDAPRLRAQLEQVRDLVPQRDNVPNFIFQVQQAANAAGLAFVKITPEVPEPPATGAQVAEIRMVLGAEGGYFALQDFVRRLYRLDRAVRIDLLTMGPEDENIPVGADVLIDLEATARIFFELPAGGVTTTTTTTTTTTPADGASPTPTPTEGG